MLHEINMAARDEELVFRKKSQSEEEAASSEIMDPDKFPINRLSGDLVKEYDNLWNS